MKIVNWKESSLLLLYIYLGCIFAMVFYQCPMVMHITISSGLFIFYKFWENNKLYKWEKVGRINRIYFFNEGETKKHFVAYFQEENNTNRVVQHIYGSIDENLLESHVERQPIVAIDEDKSPIELYSCDSLICHHIKIMAQGMCTWYDIKGEKDLCFGITKQDWVLNEEKVWRAPRVMLDIDIPEYDIFSRFRNPHDNYIFGRSCSWKIDLKIKREIYEDVSVCMNVFEDRSIALYENFWMYAINCSLKLAENGKIAEADDVFVRYREREKNLLKY